jgi:cytochrome P450 family 49 subfamily A
MMRQGVRAGCSLLAQGQQQVLRNVSAVVLKRCNSTAAVTEARPEEWDYAKPFKDIPGPKPLPVIGNAWRFIPYIGKVPYCFVIPSKVHAQYGLILFNEFQISSCL